MSSTCCVITPGLCPAQLQGLWVDVLKTGMSQGSTHMPWCVGVIGRDGSDPGMKAGLCAFQRVVSLLPAPSWGANNTLPIACSHIYMKFKTIQWFDHFGLPDEARESLSAYLKAAPLCSKACLAPAAIGKVCAFVTKLPWHLPGCISLGLAWGKRSCKLL